MSKHPVMPLALDTEKLRTLDFTLVDLFRCALSLFEKFAPVVEYRPADGMIEQLDELSQRVPADESKAEIKAVMKGLRTYFGKLDPIRPLCVNGHVLPVCSEDGLAAYLLLTPPRGDAAIPTINSVREALDHAGIKYGIDMVMVNRAVATVRERNDIVWFAPVAIGDAPQVPPLQQIDFKVSVIDKAVLKDDPEKTGELPPLQGLLWSWRRYLRMFRSRVTVFYCNKP